MSELETASKKLNCPFPEGKIDLAFRILQSFWGMVEPTYIKEFCVKLADVMADESLVDLSVKSAKVNRMSEILMANLVIFGPCNNELINAKCVLESDISLMSDREAYTGNKKQNSYQKWGRQK